MEDHPSTVASVAYENAGKRVVTSCLDGRLRLWDAESGERLREILVAEGIETIVAPAPSSEQWAIVGSDDYLRIMERGEIIHQTKVGLPRKYQARWSPNGERLAVTLQSSIGIYSAHQLRLEQEILVSEEPFSVDWSPDGRLLCVGHRDGRVGIISTANEEPIRSFAAHDDHIWDVEWNTASDEILTASADGSVALWRTSEPGKPRLRAGQFTRGISAAAWSPSGDLAVSSSADGHFCLWDVNHRRAIGEFEAHRNWIRSIEWAPNSNKFMTASQDGTIAVWDPGGLQQSPTPQRDPVQRVTLPGYIGGLWDATWMPSGKIVAVSDRGWLVTVDPEDPDRFEQMQLEEAWLRGVAVSRDESMVAVTSTSGRIWVLDPSKNLAARIECDVGAPCFGCAISPGGHLLAVATGGHSIALVDLSTGDILDPLEGHDSQVWAVAFSQDGARLASAGADGTVRVWAIQERRQLSKFRLETSCISTTFNSQGKLLFGSAGAWALDPAVASEERGPRAKTLTDTPTALLDGPAEADLLGRTPLVEEFAFFLNRTAEYAYSQSTHGHGPDGFMVHLGGRWGAGKTSLAYEVARRVARPRRRRSSDPLRHWIPIYLNAWSAAQHGPAWWGVATTLRAGILKDLGPLRRMAFRVRELSFRYPRLFLKLGLGVILLFLSFRFGFEPTRDRLVALFQESQTEPAPGLSILANLVTVSIPVLAALAATRRLFEKERRRWRWPRRPNAQIDLDAEWNANLLPRAYVTWLRQRTQDDVLLTIDDLDRCPPDFVVEMLSALQTVCRTDATDFTLNLARRVRGKTAVIAVLVAAERVGLESAIESRLAPERPQRVKTGKGFGTAFLEKIFIASVELPRLLSSQRRHLLLANVGPQRLETPVEDKARRASPKSTDTHRSHDVVNETASAQDLAKRIAELTNPDPAEVSTITRLIHAQPPENREAMHRELARRVHDPAYLEKEEARLLSDFGRLMEPTPRGVKRTLVAFWLNRAIIQSLPLHDAPSDEDVMRWTILTLRWPSVVNELLSTGVDNVDSVTPQTIPGESSEFVEVTKDLDVRKLCEALHP